MSDKITKIKIDGNIYTIDLDRSDEGVRDSLVDILKVLQGTQEDLPEGLISKEDKRRLDAIYATFGEQADADELVNTIKEILKVFENYPETKNLIQKLNEIDSTIDALDLATVGSDGGYIKTISQTNGKVSAARQAFATSIGTDGDDNNAPTTKAVRDTIKALDVSSVGSDGSYLKTISETDGKISATKQAFDTSIPATGSSPSNINAPTTKAVRDAIDALDVSTISNTAGKTVATISETDGKVAATFQDISITSSQISDKTNEYNSAGTVAITGTGVKKALETLDITDITNTAGKTISKITETDGKVGATFQDISITSSQINDKTDSYSATGTTAVTGKAVKAALETLDITDITNTAGKTVSKITETDGKVGATFQDISIASSQINDKTNSYSETGEVVVTGKSIKAAIDGLTDTLTGTPGASKTLTAFDEVGGKVTATFNNISIASSQINDLQNTYSETDGKAISGKGVKAAIDGLTDTLTGAPSASKTLTAFDEVGGKVTATFSDIAIAESQVTNLVTDLSNKADLVDGIIPATQLPSYVDDVIEFAKQVSGATWLADTLATAEGTRVWNAAAASQIPGGTSSPYYKKFLVNTNGTEAGLVIEAPETGKIYVGMTDTNCYRWSGSNLVEISKSLGLGETSTTAYAGNKGKANATAIAALQDSKLDKITDSTVNAVYGVLSDGSQYMWNVTSGGNGAADNGKLVGYHSNGNITVPETPTANTDAVSKKYVDGDGTITGIKKFTKTPVIEMGSGNDTSAGITFKGNSGDSASVTLRKQKGLNGTYEITIPTVNGTLVTAETVSQYETKFNGSLRAWGIFSRGNTWDEDAGEQTNTPVAGLYFDEGVAPVIYNEAREIDLSGFEDQDDSDVTIYWPAKESDDNIELTLPNISGTLALAADVNAKYTKPSGGIPNTDIAPSSTNGQVLSTVNGATVWTNISGTGTVTQVTAGTGLTTTAGSSTDGGNITGNGTLYLTKTGVTEGTYTKLDVDEYGRVTYGKGLTDSDIPNLPASKITSGTIPNARIASANYWNNMINILLNATAGAGHAVKLWIDGFGGGSPVYCTGHWNVTFYYADGTTSSKVLEIPDREADNILEEAEVIKFTIDSGYVQYNNPNNSSMTGRLLMQDEDGEWSFTQTPVTVLNADDTVSTFYALSDIVVKLGFEVE